MAAQRKYPQELRERAVKMVSEILERDGKGGPPRQILRRPRPQRPRPRTGTASWPASQP